MRKQPIPVAFAISSGAVVLDFCGPWEVFQDAGEAMGSNEPFFDLYTVAERDEPLTTSGGMRVIPNYTIHNAPQPAVIVIPSQRGATDTLREWIRRASRGADVTASVCTGAFTLAETGLLDGKTATTHHCYFDAFAARFPQVRLERGPRFVEQGNLATAGGLSSGIDLAIHIVERYCGREVAAKTADFLEYRARC